MRERAVQPDLLDTKTGERVQYLFAHRGKMVGQSFIDGMVVPALCENAGVPREDSRGNMTSHRHRTACVRCDFDLPKDSAYGQALETRTSVQRPLEEVPLSDDERTAAEGDRDAVDRFISRLEDKVATFCHWGLVSRIF